MSTNPRVFDMSSIIEWANTAIDQSNSVRNATAIESEFFEWFDDIHKGKRSKIVILPYLKDHMKRSN